MSPLLALLLQIVVVVSSARVLGSLFNRLGQPRVIGEMVAGVLLGPSLFGRVAPDLAGKIFEPSSMVLLDAFSQIGLVLFMFLVGLRLDAAHLRSNRRVVMITSYTSMALPFAIGVALSSLFIVQFGVGPSARLPFVLFVGLSLSITAFPVLVRIVRAHRLDMQPLGTIAIACAAFDDVTAWIVLAMITSLVNPKGVTPAESLLWLGGYVAVMLAVVRPLLRRLLQRVADRDGRFTLALIAALASAAATEWLGIHPLFGSFFLGALLARDERDAAMYEERIEPLTLSLFLPLFFAYAGLRTNLYLLTSPRLIVETAIVLALAVLGKAAGPLVTRKALGLSGREAIALATLLNTRGLVEIVVLNIGLELGLLSPSLFAMLMLMALLTTAMTSPLLRRLGYPGGG